MLSIALAFPRLLIAGDWERWEDCELVEDKYMDGDSFYVSRGPRSEYIIRLYFVDCPESDNRYPERVGEQAEYFGISMEDSLESGDEATEFTRAALKKGFTVHTRKEKSYSSSSKPRYYGFIEYASGEYLGEELVRNGWARIYGKPSRRPDGMSQRRIYSRLKKLEREAKEGKNGAWNYNAEIQRSAKVSQKEPEIEQGRRITIDKTISIYTLKKPYKFRGLLRSGAEVTLHELREHQYVVVSFESDDRQIKGVCMKRDLDL